MSKQQSIQDMERLIEDVHKNAVAHGWWDKPPGFPEILALCHSELSEALEEYRNGNPPLYGPCAGGSKSCEHYYNCDRHEPEGCKPEGAAVELADCILRIFRLLCLCANRYHGYFAGKARIQQTPPV